MQMVGQDRNFRYLILLEFATEERWHDEVFLTLACALRRYKGLADEGGNGNVIVVRTRA